MFDVSRYQGIFLKIEILEDKKNEFNRQVFTRKSTCALYDIYKKIQTREIPF